MSSDRSPTRETKPQSSENRSAYVYAADHQASGCDQEDADLVPHGNASARATWQATRRTAAAARGDCLVCCRRPQTTGTRCEHCAGLRANEAARSTRAINRRKRRRMVRPKKRAEINAAQYKRLRARGVCTRCGGATKRWAQCLACRLEMVEVRKAAKAPGVPTAASKPKPAASDRDSITSPHRAAESA